MRCLQCHRDGVPTSAVVCPGCGIHLPTLLRDVLASGTSLRDGTYRIDYALGQGGFGITYRAVNVKLEQVVAIKEFYPQEHVHRETESRRVGVPPSKQEAFTKGLERFIREGRTLARLKHPGTVRVHDLFEESGTAYLVMEMVAGRTLRAELDTASGRLAPSRVTEIMVQLVDALAAVHAENIAHLDLKPDNLILTPDDRVVLIDFGACKQDVTAHTRSTTRAFTMEYAPPELVAGSDVGPESDLYEVGVMLQEMLTGTLPPAGVMRVLSDSWTPPAGLGEPWARLLTTALRVQRADRPADIRAWWAGTAAAPESIVTPVVERPIPIPNPPGDVALYDVILVGFNLEKKPNLMHAVRELMHLSLVDTLALLGSLPQPVARALVCAEAQRIGRILTDCGGSVELHAAVTTPSPPLLDPPVGTAGRADVVLTGFNPARKINVIKLVREMTGKGLAEVKDLVESVPQVVLRDVPLAEAREMERKLNEGGGYVELHAADAPARSTPAKTPERKPTPSPVATGGPPDRTTTQFYDVILIGFNPENTATLLQAVYELAHLTLVDAKMLLADLPRPVLKGMPYAEAARAVTILLAAGGRVELQAVGTTPPPGPKPEVKPEHPPVSSPEPVIHVPFDLERPGATPAPAKKKAASEPEIEIDFGHDAPRPTPEPAKKKPAEPEIVVPFGEERTPARPAPSPPVFRPVDPVIQYSDQIHGGWLALLSLGSLGLIWLTFQHYVLRVGGGANVLGGIIWAVVVLVFGLIMGLVWGTVKTEVTGGKLFARFMAVIIALYGVPGLGLIASRMYPDSIWAAWWLLYLVGFVVLIISGAVSPSVPES